MPVEKEHDFDISKLNDEFLNCDSLISDPDYFTDDDYLVKITNEMEFPLFNDQNILLNEMQGEESNLSDLCSFEMDTSLPLQNNTNIDIEAFKSEPFNAIGPEFSFNEMDLDYNLKLENLSDNETRCTNSESPTPSQSSNDSLNQEIQGKAILDTPPISPLTNASSSPNSSPLYTEILSSNETPPVIINGQLYNVISVNGNKTILQKIPKKTDNSNEVPIFNNLNKNIIISGENLSNISLNNPPTVKIVRSNIKTPTISIKKENFMSTQMKIPINNTTSNRKSLTVFPKCLPKQEPIDRQTVQLINLPKSNESTATLPINIPKSQFNSDFDLKAYKRQQRMIKNRESACMSRKRKKDYVASLEKQIYDLTIENKNLKKENITLKEMLSKINSTIKPVFKIPSNATKGTAILLAMLLMVSVNIGSIGKIFFNNNDDSSLLKTTELSNSHYYSRHLLWDADVNDSNNSISNNSNKNDINFLNNNTEQQSLLMCPMYVNQSESIRLASELKRWIREPDYNWTNFNSNPIVNHLPNTNQKPVKPSKIFNWRSKHNKFYGFNRKNRKYISENEIQIYNFGSKYYEYAEFFESINKRDDTFYIVSFSADQMLLPATNHNKTHRPKMSLLMPAITINDNSSTSNEHIKMIKIDCEVTNTNLINLRQKSIPSHLRNSFNNASYTDNIRNNSRNKSTKKSNMNVSSKNISITNQEKQKLAYKPYFINSNYDFDYDNKQKIYPLP